MLADALRRDGDLIIRLYGQFGAEPLVWLFRMPEGDKASQTYRRWVRQVLEEALNRSARYGDPDAIARATAVLDIHAPAVRDLLQKDETFCTAFVESYWPAFSKAVEIAEKSANAEERNALWYNYVADPRVWRYYHLLRAKGEDSYRVFERYGAVAVDLMLATEYRDMRDDVLRVLRDADQGILEGLADENLRSQPLFRNLLRRKLPSWAVAKAVGILQSQPAEAPRRLRYWDGLADAALLDDIVPPPEGSKTWVPGYYVYYLARKAAQGRETETFDYVWALVDLSTLLFPGGKGLTAGRSLVQTAVRKGASQVAIRGTRSALAKAGARAVAPLAIKEANAAARRGIMEALASRGAIDVTTSIRWMYAQCQRLGLGRKTVKALTGLEARAFMRADRRAVFYPGKLFAENSVFPAVLNETAVNAGFDVAANTPLGQAATKAAVQAGIQSAEMLAKQREAWRQHLSAWWTAVHTGALDAALNKQSPATDPAKQTP